MSIKKKRCGIKILVSVNVLAYRAGTRFYMRGVSSEGHSANFVETEQIVQFDRNGDPRNRYLTAFVQVRAFCILAITSIATFTFSSIFKKVNEY